MFTSMLKEVIESFKFVLKLIFAVPILVIMVGMAFPDLTIPSMWFFLIVFSGAHIEGVRARYKERKALKL